MAEESTQQNVQVRIDQSQMRATYANAFRHHSTGQEVIIDFGINVVTPPAQPGDQAQMNFQIDNRLAMNYVTAKRLAVLLGQVVQQFEQRNGEIKLEQ